MGCGRQVTLARLIWEVKHQPLVAVTTCVVLVTIVLYMASQVTAYLISSIKCWLWSAF